MIYFVSTPIGNLEDITLRALRVLKESDIIYCEDTRTSKKLLDYYEIEAKLYSYHKFNEQKRVDEIINLAEEDKTISIISDAGMPGISDPGNILIRGLIEANIEYTVLPGPSAFTTALVLSGFNNDEFIYLGFMPTKASEKLAAIEKIKNVKATSIFYETPHRIKKTLGLFAEHIPEHKICLVREISKMYEQVQIFTAKDYEDIEIIEKGEMVLLVDKFEDETEVSDDHIEKRLLELLETGMSKKSAVKEISKELNLNKNRVYDLSLNLD